MNISYIELVYKKIIYYVFKFLFDDLLINKYTFIIPKNYSICFNSNPIFKTIIFPYSNNNSAYKTLTLESNSRLDDELIKRHCHYYLKTKNYVVRKEPTNKNQDLILNFKFKLRHSRSNSIEKTSTLIRLKSLNIFNVLKFIYYYKFFDQIVDIDLQKKLDKVYVYPKYLNNSDCLSFAGYNIYKNKFIYNNYNKAAALDYETYLNFQNDIKILDFLNINDYFKNSYRFKKYSSFPGDIFKFNGKNNIDYSYNGISGNLNNLSFINMCINAYYHLNLFSGNKYFIIYLDGNMEIFSNTQYLYNTNYTIDNMNKNKKLINIDCKKCFLQNLEKNNFPNFNSVDIGNKNEIILTELIKSIDFCKNKLGISNSPSLYDTKIIYSYNVKDMKQIYEKIKDNKKLYCWLLSTSIYTKFFPLLYSIYTYPTQLLINNISILNPSKCKIVECLVDCITLEVDSDYVEEIINLFKNDYNVKEYTYYFRNYNFFGIHN